MPDPRHELFAARLRNQRLTGGGFERPEEVVAWLGAVQSQDYAGAKWGLALRAPGIAAADVDRAFDAGAILRTHVLRPTWHFVSPADIRWILALTGPRVHATNAHYYRKLELDERLFSRSRAVIERTLGDGRPRTRNEIADALSRVKIVAAGQRLAYLVMHAELDGIICSGPRRGRQFTYMLLEQRAPATRQMTRDEALAALTRRYLASHGPATVRDFSWWSGLTLRDVRTGLESIQSEVSRRDVEDRTYWCLKAPGRGTPVSRHIASTHCYLFPNYDECLIAYRDRELTGRGAAGPHPLAADLFPHHVVVDGCLAGRWRRVDTTTQTRVDVALYVDDARTVARVVVAAERLSGFVGRPVSVTVRPAAFS